MYTQLMVVARPSTAVLAPLYDFPTEPAAIAVYLLLACSFWLVWIGNRKSDAGGPDKPASSSETGREAQADVADGNKALRNETALRRGKKGKPSRAERRRRGHIDWIQ